MLNKKNESKFTAKPAYFKELYTQLVEDETKSLWDLSPVQDTLLGRTASHVIFRSVGVDISKYIAELFEKEEKLYSLIDAESIDDTAEAEFMSSWNNLNASYSTLQIEALSFRALITFRGYQLWLLDSLSKIPLSQWEKVRPKFTKSCGNPIYIATFYAWMDAIKGKSSVVEGTSRVSWLPGEMTSLEKYVMSRTVKCYTLPDDVAEQVTRLQKRAKEHGYLTIGMTQGRVSRVYNPAKKLGYTAFGLTEAGLKYHKSASVLWGLWASSIKEVKPDSESEENIMASFANSIANGVNVEILGRLRASFFDEWAERHQEFLDEAEESIAAKKLADAQAELRKLGLELRAEKGKVKKLEKDLQKQEVRYASLETLKDASEAKNTDLCTKLSSLEKKLSKLQDTPEVVELNRGLSESDQVLFERVAAVEKELVVANDKIADLYTLLSVDDESSEDSASSYEDTSILSEDFEECVKKFTGRLIINGGTKSWQERVRKWFEAQGVKVRTYDLGGDVSGIKETDTVLLNVIQNKHKYSVKFMNEVRSIGAKLLVCNVNNVEQTLRCVFKKAEV